MGSSAWVDMPITIGYPAGAHNRCRNRIRAGAKQRARWPLAVEFDWEPEFGWLGRGRSIEYDRPGEQGEDGFLGSSVLGRRAGAVRKANR